MHRDRVLLDRDSSASDLGAAGDARVDAVNSQNRLAETIITDSNKKIESMEQQVTEIKASNREVPIDLYNRIDNEKEQVAIQTEVMEKHKKRRVEISEQFNGYIERFKVLKADQKAKRERLIEERGY